jgi:hypothetical protein
MARKARTGAAAAYPGRPTMATMALSLEKMPTVR